MRSEVLFVRGLLAYASQTFAAIERVETRQRILAAWLLYCGAWVQLEAFDSTDDVQARSAETDRAIKAVAMQPELYTSFIDNQVLRNAAPKARRLVETALDAIGMADTPASMDALPERLLRALKPVELAQGVLVRREDIDQVRANVEHLLNSARGYDHLASFCRGLNEREIRQHGMRGKDRVMLSSIEAAKGLEFDHVILPGLNRGEFALGGNTPDNRNLLYVALTRARRQVTILYQAGRPSQYLFDAGLLSTPARTS
jgi:DNA helicase-2/ATP-dependent DNA helicase PcrA